MEDNKTIFSYLGELFATYGIIMLIFIILNLVLGDTAKGYSSFFEYGSGSLSTNTMLQLFLFAVIVCVMRNVFLTDRLIKKMSILARNLAFFLTITAVIVVFIILFVVPCRRYSGMDRICYLICRMLCNRSSHKQT